MSPRMHVEGAGSVEIENGQGHTFTLGAWRKRLRCWRLWLPYVSAPAEPVYMFLYVFGMVLFVFLGLSMFYMFELVYMLVYHVLYVFICFNMF